MAKTYLEGLQYGIERFEPALRRRAEMLSEALLEKDITAIDTLRGTVRAYAEVVGLLKIERDQAAGLDGTPRARLQAEYFRRLETVESILARRQGATEPEMKKLYTEVQIAEHRVDAAFLQFAYHEEKPAGRAN